MLFERAFLNQVKTASSRSFLSLFLNIFRLAFTWLDSYASMIFVLFAIHIDIVFLLTQYPSATLVLLFFLLQFSATRYISLRMKCLLFSSWQNYQLFRIVLHNRQFKFDAFENCLYSNVDVPFEWFRRDNMNIMDVNAEVLEKIFNQE